MKSNNTRRCVVAGAFVAVQLSTAPTASAQGLEWVAPGAYDFGNCGGLGGDSVPGLREQYYSKNVCLRAYDTNKCDTQARWYERQHFERKENNCAAWLRSELSNCRATVSSLRQRCYDLAK